MLKDHAEEHGVVEREGKLQIPALVWTFVFGFATGESRTLAAFRRSYNSTADKTLTAGGFYHRLTPQLADFLCDLVEQRLDEVAVPHTISDEFDRFRDIIAADGTILRLHELLADEFQPRKGEQGGACRKPSLLEAGGSASKLLKSCGGIPSYLRRRSILLG